MEEGGEGGKQHDHPNSASQAATDASSSSGTKSLKRPLVENPSAATNLRDTGEEELLHRTHRRGSWTGKFSYGDHPNPALKVISSIGSVKLVEVTRPPVERSPAEKAASRASTRRLRKDPYWSLCFRSYESYSEGGRMFRGLLERSGPIRVRGKAAKPKDQAIYPNPPLKEDAGDEIVDMQSL